MKRDPMQTMKSCSGDSCDGVPDEVFDVVEAILVRIPRGEQISHLRDCRSEVVALLMAEQEWRFCPCFAMQRTEQHARIFDLVHTNLANRLANKAVLARVA
jgi:hypothetical protein